MTRRRRTVRVIHPGVLFFIMFMICGLVATPGAQTLGAWSLLAAALSTRVVRRLVIVSLCLVGLIGIFTLVWLAYRKTHQGPWGALHNESSPWRAYLAEPRAPRRQAPRRPAQRPATPRPPADPWNAPTVRLSPAAARSGRHSRSHARTLALGPGTTEYVRGAW